MPMDFPGRYFLGANSAEGFFSLYEGFAERDGTFTWYIKGGPGNGKSTFMRKVALAAEEAGYHTEFIFCSGDPDSLDGIYIRELRTAYVDATSPHVQEPRFPGVSGKYIDLSRYYKKNAHWDCEKIHELFCAYKSEYARAYALFRASVLLAQEDPAGIPAAEETSLCNHSLSRLENRIVPGNGFEESRLFLSAYTCRGFVSLWDSVEGIDKAYLLDGRQDTKEIFYQRLTALCREKECGLIRCPDPLTPDRTEGILIPGSGICVLSHSRQIPVKRRSRIRLYEGKTLPYGCCSNTCVSGLLKKGVQHLALAKQFHDELESVYHPWVDFGALNRFTTGHIKELLKNGRL